MGIPYCNSDNVNLIMRYILLLLLLIPCHITAQNMALRNKIEQSINSQLDVRETAYNRGIMIDKYMSTVRGPIAGSWCGGFVGANLTWNGVKNPNSAWSPAYANPKDVIWTYKNGGKQPLKIDVVTYYYPNLKRVGHTGFYISKDIDGMFITIEGNTGDGGINREGDGVYKRKRHPSKVFAISRYIK